MEATVTSIASRYDTQTLIDLLADQQVKAECYGTPLPRTAWFYVCDLEERLPGLGPLLEAVAEDGALTVQQLNGILITAEEAIEAHTPSPTAA